MRPFKVHSCKLIARPFVWRYLSKSTSQVPEKKFFIVPVNNSNCCLFLSLRIRKLIIIKKIRSQVIQGLKSKAGSKTPRINRVQTKIEVLCQFVLVWLSQEGDHLILFPVNLLAFVVDTFSPEMLVSKTKKNKISTQQYKLD